MTTADSAEPLEPIDLLVEQYLDSIRDGNTPSIDDLCVQNPDLAVEIRRIFPMMGLLESAADCETQFDAAMSHSTSPKHATRDDDDGFDPRITSENLPRTFGRYLLQEELGRGNMGTVFLAEDIELGRTVALKMPLLGQPESLSAERFRREARAMASVSHPNLCPIFDVGSVEGQEYLTMELIRGQSLDQLIRDDSPIPVDRAVEFFREIVAAVGELHRAGIVHRDIKPANVMVTDAGKVFVMDLGLALSPNVDEGLTTAGDIVGSPAYLAPEQIEPELGDAGTRSDVYALGVLLFELLTGRRPFVGSALRVMRNVVTEDPISPRELRPEIGDGLNQLCLQLLQRDPESRIRSAEEVLSRLDSIGDGSTPTNVTPFRAIILWSLSIGVLILCAVTYIIRTSEGEIHVRVPDGQDVIVEVSQKGERIGIIGPQNRWKLNVKNGEYDVQVLSSGAACRLSRDHVIIRNGRAVELEVTRVNRDSGTVLSSRSFDDYFVPGQGRFSGVVRAVELGDLDGDGDLDAFAARYDSTLDVMLNDGKGNFSPGPQVPDPDSYRNWELKLGDVDADGDLDAFVTKNGNDRLWLNDGHASFEIFEQDFGTSNGNQAEIADLDGDGDLDILVANVGGITLWKNNGDSFEGETEMFPAIDYSCCVAGDIDNDGDLDLILGTRDGFPNEIWENDGSGVFEKSTQAVGAFEPWEIQMCDWDADGDSDLFLANTKAPIEVFANDGGGVFEFKALSPTSFETHGIAIFDVDLDGDLDLFESNNTPGAPEILWLSEGTRLFAERVEYYAVNAERISIGDINGDGAIDIFGDGALLNQNTREKDSGDKD